MLTAAECRQRAEECKRYAADAEDDLELATLQHIAHKWNVLAEHKAKTQSAQATQPI
jgi:hypothetical protein